MGGPERRSAVVLLMSNMSTNTVIVPHEGWPRREKNAGSRKRTKTCGITKCHPGNPAIHYVHLHELPGIWVGRGEWS